ncbi:MAG: hypothetical protein QOH41_930 [Blastocatellia bacterium]|jgi:uncharacterized protein (TIGR03118 family)|nr:hypothetical protein [Blastocatellia bacterium]
MRQFCFGTQARRLACLALVGFVGFLILPGLSTSANNSSHVVQRQVSDAPQDQQPEFVTNNYRQTNLVSDITGFAQLQDPLLVNPWGLAQLATSPFWVANQATSTATLYGGDVAGSPITKNPLNVTIPGGLPTGAVSNSGSDFVITSGGGTGPARFIFASITGNIIAWRAGTVASILASHPGHVYTGLAIGNNGTANFLYAADFANKKIDVHNSSFALTTLAGTFTDPAIPVDFAPFNIQNLGGTLYVEYAKIDPADGTDLPGPGNGFISKFDTNGNFLGRLISNGVLNSPWGLTVSPAGFGAFGNALLVGNFGDGKINAFNITTGAPLGTLNDELGSPIIIPGLWAITFGNGVGGGDTNALYFNAGYDGERHGLFGSLRSSTPALTSVQFGGPSASISEAAGSVDINVTRAGDISGSSTVNYAIFDGDAPIAPATTPMPATQGKDYLLAAGTLTFAAGQLSRTFKILIPDDGFQETPETINLVLSNPSGAALGSQSTAVVTITDNDTPPPATNPIDDAQFFVREQYFDFLNRVPDSSGLTFWTGTITSCGADAQCIQVKRINASAAFFLSAEFQKTGLTAYLAPKAALGAIPVYGRFEIDTQALQQNLIFGQPGFDAQLEANKSAFFADFVTRPEFLAKYPASQNGSDFIDALIATIQTSSGVNLTPRRPDLVNEYLLGATQAQSRGRVVRKAIDYPEEVAAEFNSAFVLMQYFGYLRRDPDTAGFNFWLAKLNAFNGNFVNADMVKAFITSGEYRQRFGPN